MRYKDSISELEQGRAEKEKELDFVTQQLSQNSKLPPEKVIGRPVRKCKKIIQKFNEVKSPIIPKSTSQEYLNAVAKQANTVIKLLDKEERTNYTLRQVNLDSQKTNKTLKAENDQLCSENAELRAGAFHRQTARKRRTAFRAIRCYFR